MALWPGRREIKASEVFESEHGGLPDTSTPLPASSIDEPTGNIFSRDAGRPDGEVLFEEISGPSVVLWTSSRHHQERNGGVTAADRALHEASANVDRAAVHTNRSERLKKLIQQLNGEGQDPKKKADQHKDDANAEPPSSLFFASSLQQQSAPIQMSYDALSSRLSRLEALLFIDEGESGAGASSTTTLSPAVRAFCGVDRWLATNGAYSGVQGATLPPSAGQQQQQQAITNSNSNKDNGTCIAASDGGGAMSQRKKGPNGADAAGPLVLAGALRSLAQSAQLIDRRAQAELMAQIGQTTRCLKKLLDENVNRRKGGGGSDDAGSRGARREDTESPPPTSPTSEAPPQRSSTVAGTAAQAQQREERRQHQLASACDQLRECAARVEGATATAVRLRTLEPIVSAAQRNQMAFLELDGATRAVQLAIGDCKDRVAMLRESIVDNNQTIQSAITSLRKEASQV